MEVLLDYYTLDRSVGLFRDQLKFMIQKVTLSYAPKDSMHVHPSKFNMKTLVKQSDIGNQETKMGEKFKINNMVIVYLKQFLHRQALIQTN